MEKLRGLAEEGYPSNEIRRMVQDAISSGIGLDKCDLKDGNSLLHQCVLQTDLQDCVIKLLSAGANPNVTNLKGETPYDIALDNGNQIAMHLLDRRREYKRQVFNDDCDISLPWQEFSLDGTSTVFLQVVYEDYVDWTDSTRINQLNKLIDQAKNDEGKYQQKLQDLFARKSKSGQNLQKLQELLKKKEIKQRVKRWEIQDLIKLNLRAVDIISEDLEKIKKILEKAESKIYWRGFVEIRRYKGLIFQKWREASLVISGSELVIDYSRDHEERMSPEDGQMVAHQSSSSVSPLTGTQNAWSSSQRTTSVSHSQMNWKDGPLRRQLRMMSTSSGGKDNSTTSSNNQRRVIHVPIHLIRTLHINKLIGDNGLEHEITISYVDEQSQSKLSTPITSACSITGSTPSSLLVSSASQNTHVRSQSIISSSYSMNWPTTSSNANTPILGADEAGEDRDSFCQADLVPGGKLRTVHLRQTNVASRNLDSVNSKNKGKKTMNKSKSTSSVDALPYVIKSLFADVNVICTLNGSPTHFLDPTLEELDLDELFSVEDKEPENTTENRRRHTRTGDNTSDHGGEDDDENEDEDDSRDRHVFENNPFPTRRPRRATVDVSSMSPVSSTSFLTTSQGLDMDDIGSTTASSLTSHSQSSNLSQVLMRAAQSNRSSLSSSSLSSHSHYHSSGSSSGATSVESVSTLTSAMQQYSRRNASLLASQLMGIEEEDDLNNNSFTVAGSRTRRSSTSSVCSNGNNNVTITSRTRNNSVNVFESFTTLNISSNGNGTTHNTNATTVRNSSDGGVEEADFWRTSGNPCESPRDASNAFSMDGDNATSTRHVSAAIPILGNNNTQNHLPTNTNTMAMSLDSHMAITATNHAQNRRSTAQEHATQSSFLSSQMWRTSTTVADASTATTITTTVSTTIAQTSLIPPPSLLSPTDLSPAAPRGDMSPHSGPSSPQRSMSLAQSSPTRSNSLLLNGRNQHHPHTHHDNHATTQHSTTTFLLHNRRAPSFQLSNHSLTSLPSPYRLRGRTVKLKEIKERTFAIDVHRGLFYRSPYLHEQMAAQIDFIPVLRLLQEHTKSLRDEMKEQLHLAIMHREELKQEYEYLFSLRTLAGNPPQAPTSVFNISSMFATSSSNIQSYSSQDFLTLQMSNNNSSQQGHNLERTALLLNLYTNHVEAATSRLRDDTDHHIISARPSFNDNYPLRSSYSMNNASEAYTVSSSSMSHSMSYSNSNVPAQAPHTNSNVIEARELLHWLTQSEHGLNEVMHALHHPSPHHQQRTFSSSSATTTPNAQIPTGPSISTDRMHPNLVAAASSAARVSPWRDSLHKVMTSPEDLHSMRVRLHFDEDGDDDAGYAQQLRKPSNEEKDGVAETRIDEDREEWTQPHLVQSTSEKITPSHKPRAYSTDLLGSKTNENNNNNINNINKNDSNGHKRHNSNDNYAQGMQSWRNRLGPPPPAYRRYFEKLLSNVEQIWNCELESYETFKKLAASILLREQTLRRISSLRSKQREVVTATHRNTVVPPPKEELYDVEF